MHIMDLRVAIFQYCILKITQRVHLQIHYVTFIKETSDKTTSRYYPLGMMEEDLKSYNGF